MDGIINSRRNAAGEKLLQIQDNHHRPREGTEQQWDSRRFSEDEKG